MALLEIDHVNVDKKLWKAAKDRDYDARDAIRKEIDGLEIYFHAMIRSDEFWDKHELITLRELEEVCPPIFVTISLNEEYLAEIDEAMKHFRPIQGKV